MVQKKNEIVVVVVVVVDEDEDEGEGDGFIIIAAFTIRCGHGDSFS